MKTHLGKTHINCRKCKTHLPYTLEFFPKNSNFKSGIDSMCRDCKKVDQKKYTQTDSHKAYMRRYSKEKYHNDPEFRAKALARDKKRVRKRKKDYTPEEWEDVKERSRKSAGKYVKTEKGKQKQKAYYENVWKEKASSYAKKRRETLPDDYVVGIIIKHNPELKRSDIPQDVIEMKRKYLKLRKEIRNGKES